MHMIGIGGVGMAGLAVLLKSRGCEVSGCDLRPSPRTRWLEECGISVAIGHDPGHVSEADEVIVTPAVSVDEPERLAARNVRFRGEVLAELVNGCDGIAVCGSHGKTTTATWIAKLLLSLGEDVSWCIGGETGDFPVAGVGRSGALVVEADESDGTLSLYRAKTLVVNRRDYDHPDHFRSEAEYLACYETAMRNAESVIDSERLDLAKFPELAPTLASLAPHNRRNARAAVEVALSRGHAIPEIAKALPSIVSQLPDRRFQRIGEGVYIDYAHHPAEIKCAIAMARGVCRGTLRVLFQPHRYSRTRALLKSFPSAFEDADEVVLCPTYAAFESPVEGGDVADLYAECRARLKLALRLARSCEEAWSHAVRSWRAGDVTLVLGAGDIVGKLSLVPHRRIWIGMGSNTWKSDLNLDVEYVRTSGKANLAGATLGIPWMAGIPGSIGGWIKMNAGAFGHSISEVVSRVKVDGQWRDADSCGFSYRHSDIEGEIQDVEWNDEALKACRECEEDFLSRRRKFPAHTWGSFFKNPPGDFAGRMLEASGAKELRVGGAYVWSEHANVIVAGDGASPSDVLALARLMQNRVFFRFGVLLQPEVCGI